MESTDLAISPGPVSPLRLIRVGRRRLTFDWGLLGNGLLLAFLVSSFINTVQPLIVVKLGLGWQYVGVSCLFVYPACLIAAVFCYERSGVPAVPVWRTYLLSFMVALIGLTVLGYLNGNGLRSIALDIFPWITFICAFTIGRRNEVWNELSWPVAFLTSLALLCGFLFTSSEIVFDRSIINDEAGSVVESTIELIFILAMAGVCRGKRSYYPLAGLIGVGSLLLYLYLGRRTGVARAALELFLAFGICHAIRGRPLAAVFGILILGLVSAAVLLYFPLDTIVSRFLGSFGFVTTLGAENARLVEATEMIRSLTGLECLFGRGMGGGYDNEVFWMDRKSIDSTTQYERSVTVHMGALLPVLKGGVIWLVIYELPLIVVLAGLSRLRSLDPITQACMMAAIVLIGFQFIELTLTYSTAWVPLGMGLVAGRSQQVLAAWKGTKKLKRPTRMPQGSAS